VSNPEYGNAATARRTAIWQFARNSKGISEQPPCVAICHGFRLREERHCAQIGGGYARRHLLQDVGLPETNDCAVAVPDHWQAKKEIAICDPEKEDVTARVLDK